MQISLLASMVPREFPAALSVNSSLYYIFCTSAPFWFSLLACFIFEGTLPQVWRSGTWASVFLMHKFTLVFLCLQVASWGWTVHVEGNFRIFHHLDIAFAYTQHQGKAIGANIRGWEAGSCRFCWFLGIFILLLEKPPGEASPVPFLSGLCLPVEHQSSPTASKDIGGDRCTWMSLKERTFAFPVHFHSWGCWYPNLMCGSSKLWTEQCSQRFCSWEIFRELQKSESKLP